MLAEENKIRVPIDRLIITHHCHYIKDNPKCSCIYYVFVNMSLSKIIKTTIFVAPYNSRVHIDIVGRIVCWTSKVMVICWRTPCFEQFARRHSGSVKLGHRTPRTGCSRLRREKVLFWTSGAPEPQLGPPLSLSLTRGPHLSSSSSSSPPLMFFHCWAVATAVD